MRRILIQAAKEWNEFKRDRLSLALALLLPLITLLLFGYGVRMQSHNIPVVIQDLNKTTLSRALVERLMGTNLFQQVACPAGRDLEKELDQGSAKACIIIPADFEQNVLSKKPAQIETLIDGTDIVNARMIETTITGASTFLLRSTGLQRPPIEIKENLRVWFNPGMKESLFIVPGVCGIVLWMFPSLLSCVATAREKEQGTIMQVYVSSIAAHELLLGKSIVYLLIGLTQAALIILLAVFLFGMKFAGNPLPFLLTVPAFVFSSVLFGFAVGSCANSQTTAVQGVSSLGFFTCLLLSGFVYPINNIPFPLSTLSYLVPSRYFIEVSRDAFERGMDGSKMTMDIVILLLFCALFFFISWSSWRRMQFKV